MKKFVMGVLFVFAAAVGNAQSNGQMSRRIDATSIPQDILSKNYTLLIYSPYNNKKLNRSFEETAQENFTGAVEVVPFKTDVAAQYADTAKYRYMLTIGLRPTDYTYSNAHNSTVANPQGTTNMGIVRGRLYLIDRSTGRTWDTGLEAQSSNKILGYWLARASGKMPD